jgi:hypothetical protein
MLPTPAPHDTSKIVAIVSAAIVVMVSVYAFIAFVQWLFTS